MSPALARAGQVIHVDLARGDDFGEWRARARSLAGAGVPPDAVRWSVAGDGEADLFAVDDPPLLADETSAVRVPREYVELAGKAVLHSRRDRFGLLYRLLWRLQQQPRLLDDATDADVRELAVLAREVRRDIHKMRAFVRFRGITGADGIEHFVAWFEPSHHVVRANARFFVDRFAAMRWTILTPALSLHWDGETLREGPPACRADAPPDDADEALWQRYYASIFNPARLKVGAMLREMPRRYWKNMPEAVLIPQLVAGAQARSAAMVADGTACFSGPKPASLDDVRTAIAGCRACPIGCNGTRAVAGQGPARAVAMIVGEQPGDREASEGQPFIGPAGQLLDDALAAAGIDRRTAYVTNAVKHFKYTSAGRRRLHQSPSAREIDICRWWLDSERAIIAPRLILALGASAARGLLGKSVGVQRARAAAIPLADGSELWITIHPSYLLRLDGGAKSQEESRFAADLSAFSRRLAEVTARA